MVARKQPSRLDRLIELRDALQPQVLDLEYGSNPALVKQYREVLADIDALEKDKPHRSVVDDLAKRRKVRRPDAAGAAPTGTDGDDKRSGRDGTRRRVRSDP